MAVEPDFLARLESKLFEQLHSQRVGYLLGAGSSYLNSHGYPLAFQLWDQIKNRITDVSRRAEIQEKLDTGASGIEEALDLLDDGMASEGPHRHLVTEAIAKLFIPITPELTYHRAFLKRIVNKGSPSKKLFTLNHDPIVERAAEEANICICDGFSGHESAFFNPSMFEERIGRIRGSYKGRRFEETTNSIHLFKLHGSLGWYECSTRGIRRGSFSLPIPPDSKRLMIPPQRRKANETMTPPYAALWSAFRGCLGQDSVLLNRLACIGYGLLDEHVNAVIEGALARNDFTLLVFTRSLSDPAWTRWSVKTNVVIVTETRSSLKGEIGPGHPFLWSFERIAQEL